MKLSKLYYLQNFDVESKLRQIAFYTADRSLRDFLVKELGRRNALKAEEREMMAFVKQMESLYTCSSFEIAKLLRTEDGDNRFTLVVYIS